MEPSVVARILSRTPPLARLALAEDAARRARTWDLLEAHAAEVSRIREGLALLARRPDPRASRAVDEAAVVVLAAQRGGSGAGLVSRLDALVSSNAPEILDGDDVPGPARSRSMTGLDHINARMGSYDRFSDMVREALGGEGSHVYDLAAGAGGFAIHLARTSGGRHLRLTSSDLREEHVRLGRERAAELCVDVAFEVHDALDLRDRTDVDLFVCTQAAHHMEPGMVLRMIHQALHAAPRGLLLIDVLRGLGPLFGAGLLIPALFFDRILALDGIQSVRRGFLPGELELLGRLAGARRLEARAIGPAHVALHAMGPRF